MRQSILEHGTSLALSAPKLAVREKVDLVGLSRGSIEIGRPINNNNKSSDSLSVSREEVRSIIHLPINRTDMLIGSLQPVACLLCERSSRPRFQSLGGPPPYTKNVVVVLLSGSTSALHVESVTGTAAGVPVVMS